MDNGCEQVVWVFVLWFLIGRKGLFFSFFVGVMISNVSCLVLFVGHACLNHGVQGTKEEGILGGRGKNAGETPCHAFFFLHH